MGAVGGRRARRGRRGRRRDAGPPRRPRDRPHRPQPARGHSVHARAQGADGGTGVGLHRPSRRFRDVRGGDRDPHLEPARADVEAGRCSSMSTASTRRCSTSSIARSTPDFVRPEHRSLAQRASTVADAIDRRRRRHLPPPTSGSTSTATSPETVAADGTHVSAVPGRAPIAFRDVIPDTLAAAR